MFHVGLSATPDHAGCGGIDHVEHREHSGFDVFDDAFDDTADHHYHGQPFCPARLAGNPIAPASPGRPR
jgi:hypothetical protein